MSQTNKVEIVQEEIQTPYDVRLQRPKNFESDKDKPAFIFVAWIACIRVFKFAYFLQSHGYPVHFLFYSNAHCNPTYLFESLSSFTYKWDMQRTLNILLDSYKDRKAGVVIEVHNEPNWPVLAVRETIDSRQDKHKIVLSWNMHDSDYQRYQKMHMDEVNSYRVCDGVVHVSPKMEEYMNDAYSYAGPSVVCPSACPAEWFTSTLREDYDKKIRGVAYQGGALTSAIANKKKASYRDYGEIVRSLIENDIPVHMFIKPQVADYYKKLGAKYEGWEEVIFSLIPKLSAFQFSLVTLNMSGVDEKTAKRWDTTTLPNKFFEAMAAGNGVVTNNGSYSSELVKEHGIGYIVDDWETFKLPEDNEEVFNSLHSKRSLFTFENYWSDLKNYYESLLGGKTGRIE